MPPLRMRLSRALTSFSTWPATAPLLSIAARERIWAPTRAIRCWIERATVCWTSFLNADVPSYFLRVTATWHSTTPGRPVAAFTEAPSFPRGVTLRLTPHWQWLSDSDFRDVERDRFLDIWYSGPELDVEIACGSDRGALSIGENDYDGTLHDYTVSIGRDQEEEDRGRLKNIRIFIQAGKADTWTIQLRNEDSSENADYYAWTGLDAGIAWLSRETLQAGKTGIFDEMTLTDTACADRF